MPKGQKLCKDCGKTHGCRKKKCECGYVFGGASPPKQGRQPPTKKKSRAVKQTKHPLGQEYVPGTGLWVFDTPKGMPAIPLPDDLPSGPTDNQAVYDHCVYNGLGHCIFVLIPSRRIADPKLRKLWKKAHDAMSNAWEYLIDKETENGK